MATHDPITPHNFDIQLLGHEGDLVKLEVTVHQSVPAGGIRLQVLWDPSAGQPVSVTPYRNLGQFLTADIAKVAGGSAGH